MADLYFTIQTINRLGKAVEMNPLVRYVVGIRTRFIWPFKFLEITLFSYLIWRISNLNEELSFSTLLGVIFVYSLVVLMGLKVFIDLTGKSLPVIVLFFALSLLLILFIQLNHVEYRNKVAVSNALSECGSNYSDCLAFCKSSTNSTIENREPIEYNLNLTIPRVI
jgi:hypothetical protein